MMEVKIRYQMTLASVRSWIVTEEQYESIKRGVLPKQITDEMINRLCIGNRETDWEATDEETGQLIGPGLEDRVPIEFRVN